MKNLTLIITLLFSAIMVTAQTTNDLSSNSPKIQVGFIYPIGTGGVQSINQTYSASVSIMAGATGGINGVEVGGFGNYTHGSVEGVQVAGFANAVKDSLEGVQVGGFANLVMKNVKAVQIGGFANASLANHTGVQVAGFANYTGKEMIGVQVSGFANATLKGMKGNQIAGFSNVAVGTMEGVQISGFINVAQKIKGAQLGFINVADTLEGVSIGFLSFARNGYHTFELSSNETFETNLSFKTGVNRFYNSFSAGVHWNRDKTVWGLGYGVGTRKEMGSRYALSADLKSYAILPDHWTGNDWESFNKLELSVSRRLSPEVEVFLGGSVNMWLSNREESQFDYLRWTNNKGSAENYNWILYPGFQAGLRLF